MLVLRPAVSKVRIDELAFSPDGSAVAAPAGHHGVMLWASLADGAKSGVIKPSIVCKRLAFTPDGSALYAGNDSLCAIDLATQDAVKLPIVPWHFLWFGISPDGKWLVISEEDKARESCRLTGWCVGEHDAPAWEMTVPGLVWSLPMFPPQGNDFLLCEHRRDAGRTWHAHRVRRSVESGRELDVSATLADVPDQVALSPDGRTLACRTREFVRVYPATGEWEDVPAFANDSKKHFTGIAFHPSGRYLAATSNDQTVKLYDTASWQVAKTYTWNIGRMRSVCFSPDGALAAAGSDTGKVVVWDVDV